MTTFKYPSINGLRAISILMVIVHHLHLQNGVLNNYGGIKWLTPFILFIQDGQMGVTVFFVISGFLITSLMLQEEINTGTVSLKNFYIRRTLRIFPAYYTLLGVYFVLQVLGFIHISNESWFTSITYTKYFNWQADWNTRHAWSLSIEEHFYIVWPVIFIAGDRFRKPAALFLIVLVPMIRVVDFYHNISWINPLTIFTRIDAIATGCLIALYKDGIIKKISPHWNKIFYFSVISLFFVRYFPRFAGKIHLKFIFIPLGVNYGTIANILIALILMYSVFGPKGLWHKILNWRIINYIGVLSYSLYLWQQIFISKTNYWVNLFPQNIFFMLLVAICSYHLIEKPFLTLKSKFSVTPDKNPMPPVLKVLPEPAAR